MFDPVLTDLFAWRRYEVAEQRWRDKCARSGVVERRLLKLRVDVAALEVEEQEFLAPGYFDPPKPPHVWQCPRCDKTFPSHASTERHILFAHTPERVAAC